MSNINLLQASFKNGFSILNSQFILSIEQLIVSIILARLLSPEDFGMLSMTISFTGFATVLKDLGLSQAIIQAKNINDQQLSNLFWINFSTGILLFLVFSVFGTYLLINYYSEPRLLKIVPLLSVCFIFGGISVQYISILKRKLQFNKIANYEIISYSISSMIAIATAVCGGKYMSLVLLQILRSFVLCLLLISFTSWRPIKPMYNVDVRGLLHFGRNVVLFDLLVYVSRNIDNVLIGKFYGSSILGFYAKAYEMLLAPIAQIRTPLSTLALSILSKTTSLNKKRSAYIFFIEIVAYLCTPFIMFLCLRRKEIIILILGNKWTGVSEIFFWLSYAAVAQAYIGVLGPLLLSRGDSARYLKWGLFYTLTIVMSILIGLNFSFEMYLNIFVCVNVLLIIPSSFYCLMKSDIQIGTFLYPIVQAVLIGVITYWIVMNVLVMNKIDNIFIIVIFLAKSFMLFFLTYYTILFIYLLFTGRIIKYMTIFRNYKLYNR